MKTIKEFLSNYIKKFESDTLAYIKVNAVALVIILVAIISLIVWLLPNENLVDEKVYAKNTEIAKNIDERTLEYKDEQLAMKQESQLKEIQSGKKSFSFFHLLIFIPILGIVTSLLATFMQALYTKLKFTDNPESTQRVLSAALFSSALIVCVVFAMWYYKTYLLIQ